MCKFVDEMALKTWAKDDDRNTYVYETFRPEEPYLLTVKLNTSYKVMY